MIVIVQSVCAERSSVLSSLSPTGGPHDNLSQAYVTWSRRSVTLVSLKQHEVRPPCLLLLESPSSSKIVLVMAAICCFFNLIQTVSAQLLFPVCDRFGLLNAKQPECNHCSSCPPPVPTPQSGHHSGVVLTCGRSSWWIVR